MSSHFRSNFKKPLCVRQIASKHKLAKVLCTVWLAANLTFGFPLTPLLAASWLQPPALANDQTQAPLQSLSESAPSLRQGEPEPLDRGDGSATVGGAPTKAGVTKSAAADNDDNSDSSGILPTMQDRSSLTVGAPRGAASDDNSSAAIRMPGGEENSKTVDSAAGSSSGAASSASSTTTTSSSSSSSSDAASQSASDQPFSGSSLSSALSTGSGDSKLTLPADEFIMPAGGLLRGRVSETPERSPLLSGSVQTIPDGIKVDLTLQGNLNSEVSQKGSEVFAQISRDVTDASGNKVYLPGGWVAHGFVTARSGQKRHSGAGWAEVTFDRIISPDGKYDVPFDAKVSTKDNSVVAVTKVLATDTKYMSMGAVAGGVLSVQMTGLPLAVASHGYSVAIGAAIGAGIGLVGAIRKKGPILSLYPGEHLKLTTSGSIQMPGFNLANLPSAKPKERVIGLFMQINEARMFRDDFSEDKKARILRVNFTVENHTQREFLLNNLRVVSELNEVFPPHLSMMGVKFKPLSPTSSQTITVPFSVDAGKHQYWLLLTDARGEEVRREPIKITSQILDKF